MKVHFLPASPKFGQPDEHLPSHVAAPLIAAGFCSEVKLPPRGSNGWHAARVAESLELSGGRSHPGDTCPIHVDGVQWSVEFLPRTGKPAVFKRVGVECYRFEDSATLQKYGCPPAILEQFTAAVSAPQGQEFAALEKARREQAQREIEEKTSRWKWLAAGA